MLEPTTDPTQADGFFRYSRGVALSRLALVACFTILIALYAPQSLILLGILEFGLYFALFLATEIAVRKTDRQKAFNRLRWQSDILMVLLVANACWIAVEIRLYGDPILRVEAALLAICVLLFAALRVHMSRMSYIVGVAPPVATLLWLAVEENQSLAENHYPLAMLLFVGAVITVTWRQHSTDRALTEALADLGRKNLALTAAMKEAEDASHAKTRLLAVASHEIRTPLNAVMGFAQALRQGPLTKDQAALVEGVAEGGAQLTRLLDAILAQVRGDAPAPAGSPSPQPTAGERKLVRPIRVLAAEDNAANREVLTVLLNAAPVELVLTEDGLQAVQAWREGAFDLILMDANMPIMDGVDALREIRGAETSGARIPIWMVTANVFDDDVARYMEAGADGVLPKPINVAALFEVLANVAERRTRS